MMLFLGRGNRGGGEERKGTEKNIFFVLLIVIYESLIQLQNDGNKTQNIHIYSFSQVNCLFKIVAIFSWLNVKLILVFRKRKKGTFISEEANLSL